jgi:hypothetical protein
MKWFILLILFLMLAAIIAVRYRRQINIGIEIFKMFRRLKNQAKPQGKKLDKKAADKSVPLVRCARCGTWTPQTSALNLRSKTFYCSTNCMEKAVSFNS